MDFNVYTIDDPEWEKSFNSIPSALRDIYYSPQWYKTWEAHEKAEALCISFESSDFHILYPFFRKKINNYDPGGDYYDIQSAYGYGGVIVNSPVLPVETGNQFNRVVNEWLKDTGVIAEFIRANPQLPYFSREAEYSVVRKNVYINTVSSYRIPEKCARQNIAKALSSGLTVFYDHNLDYLDEFIDLYNVTMHRLEMHPYYNFGEDYFFKVKKYLNENASLIHIVKDDKIVAAGLYIRHEEKANLHLAGSLVEYQILRANDLLYHAAILHSLKNRVLTLNVGGGTTKDPDDNLLRFKKKYSNNVMDVKIGKNIINRNVYDRVTRNWALRHPELENKYSNYFLKYHQEV